MKNNEYYMNLALKEAEKGYKKGEVPVGVIIVRNNKIISKSYNKKEKNRMVTHHAEILAIQKACKKLHTWHLDDCVMYVTLEPCMMCCGAIYQSRIKKIYYATQNINNGFLNSKYNIKNVSNIEIEQMKKEFSQRASILLKEFFKNQRK